MHRLFVNFLMGCFIKIHSFKMMVIRQDSVPDVITNKCG